MPKGLLPTADDFRVGLGLPPKEDDQEQSVIAKGLGAGVNSALQVKQREIYAEMYGARTAQEISEDLAERDMQEQETVVTREVTERTRTRRLPKNQIQSDSPSADVQYEG